MINDIKNSKFLKGVALGIIIALILFALKENKVAQADFWNDLFRGIISPFYNSQTSSNPVQNKETQSTNNQSSVILYKPVVDYEQAVISAVKKVSPSVVSITISKNVPIIEECPYNPFSDLPPDIQRFFGNQFFEFYTPCPKGEKLKEVGWGTGFIISEDGLILTNKHVVLDVGASYTVLTNDGKKYNAKILARDPIQDLAILKIEGKNFKPVDLGNSDELELGQSVIAIGNALGEFRNTVSVGVVSGLARTVTAGGGGFEETIHDVIQTDAAINPGNSGGPLINLRGEVIGINTAMASGAENIGFAIPINKAKRAINSIKSKGKIEAPFLGVRYLIINSEIAKERKLPVDYGALIEGDGKNPAVVPNSPASRAGIQKGDIILEINGQKINENNTLAAIISRYSPGDWVNLKILREGREINISLQIGQYPD